MFVFIMNKDLEFIHIVDLFYSQPLFPYRRADLTSSALLQGIRGEGPQLHALRLASAASLARETGKSYGGCFIKEAEIQIWLVLLTFIRQAGSSAR